MEENQQNIDSLDRNCQCRKPHFCKCIIIGLLIFLGAYCAFYVVADWYFKNAFHLISYNQNAKKESKNPLSLDYKHFDPNEKLFTKSANIIHLQQLDNAYRVSVDLSAFDNNINNVNVKTNGNLLSISGRTIKRGKHHEQISEFQQNYLFGDEVKLENLVKDTDGHYYTITIPIEKQFD